MRLIFRSRRPGLTPGTDDLEISLSAGRYSLIGRIRNLQQRGLELRFDDREIGVEIPDLLRYCLHLRQQVVSGLPAPFPVSDLARRFVPTLLQNLDFAEDRPAALVERQDSIQQSVHIGVTAHGQERSRGIRLSSESPDIDRGFVLGSRLRFSQFGLTRWLNVRVPSVSSIASTLNFPK